jgi:hypothetical protein
MVVVQGGFAQVVPQFAPFVARNNGVNQVVSFYKQTNSMQLQHRIHHLLHRRKRVAMAFYVVY